MVHGAATLPVLLIIEVESDRVGVAKLGQRSAVRKDEALLKESNILSPELHGACFGTSGGHRIFARSQQKERGDSE